MSKEENKPDEPQMAVEVVASQAGLSLKAKGAGFLVLISLCIVGIVVLGYQMTKDRENSLLILPIMFLLWISQRLVSLAGAVLGFSFVSDDAD